LVPNIGNDINVEDVHKMDEDDEDDELKALKISINLMKMKILTKIIAYA
jgi:hypothetical protein